MRTGRVKSVVVCGLRKRLASAWSGVMCTRWRACTCNCFRLRASCRVLKCLLWVNLFSLLLNNHRHGPGRSDAVHEKDKVNVESNGAGWEISGTAEGSSQVWAKNEG